jgi:hypothetical protein
VKTGLSQGTAGSIYQVLDFTNIANVTCTLYGYPGVSFASTGPGGGQIGAAAQENPATPRRLVTLAPGAVANALLRIVDAGNYPPATCHPVTAHWLVIYPPNQTTRVGRLVLIAAAGRAVAAIRTIVTIASRPGGGSGG